MVRKVRIFVEGGGTNRASDSRFRRGFNMFFSKALGNFRGQLRIELCGSRSETCKDFLRALDNDTEEYNVLLVDSESPVMKETWKHLQEQDRWDLKPDYDEHCHLMVQVMESWFLADTDALKRFFGREFNETSIPRNNDIEAVSKAEVFESLKRASKKCGCGEYDKGSHAPKILEMLDAVKVRNASRHCDRLFLILAEKTGERS